MRLEKFKNDMSVIFSISASIGFLILSLGRAQEPRRHRDRIVYGRRRARARPEDKRFYLRAQICRGGPDRCVNAERFCSVFSEYRGGRRSPAAVFYERRKRQHFLVAGRKVDYYYRNHYRQFRQF